MSVHSNFLQSAIGNALEWQLFCPTAYTFAQRLHTCEFKGTILHDDPAGNALTVAAWGFVSSATSAQCALDGSAIALQAIQKVLLDRKQVQDSIPVLDAASTHAQTKQSTSYMKQSALKQRGAQYGATKAGGSEASEDPQEHFATRSTSGGSMGTTTRMPASVTPLPLVFGSGYSGQTPDSLQLGSTTPFAVGLLVPVPHSVMEQPPAGSAGTARFPALHLPGNLVLPLSQESDCTLEDEDVSLEISRHSLQLSAEEPETPGVDMPASTPALLPSLSTRKPKGLAVSIPSTPKGYSWEDALPARAAPKRTTLKLAPAKKGVNDSSHAMALLQREPTMMDSIAAQLGFVPVVSVGLNVCPAEIAI